MKAIVYTQYGAPEVLQLKEVAKLQPKENEILVKDQKPLQSTQVTCACAKRTPFAVRFIFGLLKPCG